MYLFWCGIRFVTFLYNFIDTAVYLMENYFVNFPFRGKVIVQKNFFCQSRATVFFCFQLYGLVVFNTAVDLWKIPEVQ